MNPFSNGTVPFDKVVIVPLMKYAWTVMDPTVLSAGDGQSPDDILTGNYTAGLLGFSRGLDTRLIRGRLKLLSFHFFSHVMRKLQFPEVEDRAHDIY